MRTRGLVRPMFLAQTTWFWIPNFCNAEGEWLVHGVEDHEYVTAMAYVCQWVDVGWMG